MVCIVVLNFIEVLLSIFIISTIFPFKISDSFSMKTKNNKMILKEGVYEKISDVRKLLVGSVAHA